MTSRADMVEKMARTLAALELDEDWPSNEALGGNLTGTRDDEYRDGMLEEAARVLDAVLPLVSTVAELEALPLGSILLGHNDGYRPVSIFLDKDTPAAHWIEWYAPLTVVWQP